MPLPDENPTYTKIDDRNFYLSKTSSTQYNVDEILTAIKFHQTEIDKFNTMLDSVKAIGLDTIDKSA